MSLNSRDANYRTALGLQKDPFSPEPDSQFYYSFDSFEQRLKILHSLVQGVDLFVLVIGEPGSGKTTLLNRYLASSDTEWKSARIHTDLETAASHSSAPQGPRGYPVYISQDSADPVVIVDDAHQLHQKELEFLIHEALLPGSSDKIKRLVLFGESVLYTAVTKLAVSLSAQPAVNKIYLPGLTGNQTAEYLQHRLAIGGYSGKFPFNSSAISSIHRTSGGYPGPINEIAHQWLNDKYSNKKERHNMLQRLSGTSRRMVAWFGAGIIIILLAAFWFFSDRKPPSPKAPDPKLTKTVFRKKIVPYRKSADPTVGEKVATVKTPVKPPAAVQTQPTPATTISAKPPTPVKTEQPQKVKPIPAGPAITAPPKKVPPPKTGLQQAAKPAHKTPAPVTTKTAAREIRREKWLLTQDATSYTIQIIGVSNEKSVLDFVKKNQLLKLNEIAYYESTFRGSPWYQVLYGIYPTKQEAQLVANRLPENIRQAGPWIRRLSGVQNAIEK